MRAIVIGTIVPAMLLCAGIGAANAETQGTTARTYTDRSLPQTAQKQPIPPNGSEVAGPEQQPQSGSNTKPGSLSHELSRSGGVIHPPPSGDKAVVAPPNSEHRPHAGHSAARHTRREPAGAAEIAIGGY